MGDTTIRVSDELADELYDRKERGESYEDVIWRLIDESEDGEEGGLEREVEREESESPPPAPVDVDEEPVEDTARAAAQNAIDNLDIPGRGGTDADRRDALLRMFNYLYEHEGEKVPKSELTDLVDPDEVGYASVDSFWTNCVKKSGDRPNALTAIPGVEELGNGRYRFTKEDDD